MTIAMHKFFSSFSPLSAAATLAGGLFVAYLALIAVVMSYAALSVQFSQSERNDEAVVATLEAQYLSSLSTITNTDYLALGYAKPAATVFVPARAATALR